MLQRKAKMRNLLLIIGCVFSLIGYSNDTLSEKKSSDGLKLYSGKFSLKMLSDSSYITFTRNETGYYIVSSGYYRTLHNDSISFISNKNAWFKFLERDLNFFNYRYQIVFQVEDLSGLISQNSLIIYKRSNSNEKVDDPESKLLDSLNIPRSNKKNQTFIKKIERGRMKGDSIFPLIPGKVTEIKKIKGGYNVRILHAQTYSYLKNLKAINVQVGKWVTIKNSIGYSGQAEYYLSGNR